MTAAHEWRGGTAQLFRARADFQKEVNHSDSELIGDGDLAKMVRIALTDPDGEVWRYSIRAGEMTLLGDQIRRWTPRKPSSS